MPRNSKKTNSFLQICLALILMQGLSSCYEAIEGCLDAKASNFDFDADNDCSDCCNYPSLVINLDYWFGKIQFEADSTYVNNLGHELILNSHDFILSDVAVSNAEDDFLTIGDSLILNCNFNGSNQTIKVSNSHQCVGLNTRAWTLNNFRSAGQFDNFYFALGIDQCAITADTSILDKESGLWDVLTNKQYTGNDELIQQNFSFVSPLNRRDTIQIQLFGNLVQNFNIPFSALTKNGDNLVVNLHIDYSIWLKDIDIVNDDKQSIKDKLTTNSTIAFTIEE